MTNDFTIPKLPEFSTSKNGYQIRADILAMATGLVQSEYSMKFQGWAMTSYKDEKTGQIITDVKMPDYPGLEKVLEVAQKMYDFVGNSKAKS